MNFLFFILESIRRHRICLPTYVLKQPPVRCLLLVGLVLFLCRGHSRRILGSCQLDKVIGHKKLYIFTSYRFYQYICSNWSWLVGWCLCVREGKKNGWLCMLTQKWKRKIGCGKGCVRVHVEGRDYKMLFFSFLVNALDSIVNINHININIISSQNITDNSMSEYGYIVAQHYVYVRKLFSLPLCLCLFRQAFLDRGFPEP